MNNLVKCDVGVGLADSELISYNYSLKDDKLILFIMVWDGRALELSFSDQILFIDSGCKYIQFFCENKNKENKLFLEAIESAYENPLGENPHRLFQIIDVDDKPSIQIVATRFNYKLLD